MWDYAMLLKNEANLLKFSQSEKQQSENMSSNNESNAVKNALHFQRCINVC